MKLPSRSTQVRLLGRRSFNVFKFSVIKIPLRRRDFYYDLEALKYVQVDLGLSL
jgi:hypothetical protein